MNGIENSHQLRNLDKANDHKLLGNATYWKRKFDQAIRHYDEAIRLGPDCITFYYNKSVAYYEKGDLEKCVQVAKKAVQIGRDNKADYKLIAKPLLLIGSANIRSGKIREAHAYIEVSYTYHRTPYTFCKLSLVQKLIKEKERLDSIDLELAIRKFKKGCSLYGCGEFAEAIKCFSTSIELNPDYHRTYLNRAGCYLKLAEFELALKDCERCVNLNSSPLKVWIYTGRAYLGLKDCVNADYAFERALNLEPNSNEVIADYRKSAIVYFSLQDTVRNRFLSVRRMEDILADVGIRLIVQQMILKPDTAVNHLKDSQVAEKIMYLLSTDFRYPIQSEQKPTNTKRCCEIIKHALSAFGLLVIAVLAFGYVSELLDT